MGYSYGSIEQGDPKKRQRPVRVFRFKRDEEPRPAWGNTPFTEKPAELKREPPGFLLVLQEAVNLLLLLILALTLIVLVVAFAYQWLTAPEVIVTWCQDLVNSVTSFFQQLISAIPA